MADKNKDNDVAFTINDGEFLDSVKEIWGDDYENLKRIVEDSQSPVAQLMKNE